MKMLCVGQCFTGSTLHHRVQGLRCLGIEVHTFAIERYFPVYRRGMHSIWRRLNWGPPIWHLNRDLLQEVDKLQPDIVWVEKGLTVSPDSLRHLAEQGTYLIHWSNDDQSNPDNQSKFYRLGVPLYHLHLTTKSFNVPELKDAGAQTVIFAENGYDPFTFYPRNVSEADKYQLGSAVGFIGAWEQQRASSLLFLATHDVSTRIWGPGWKNKQVTSHPLLKLEGRPLWGEDYPRAICATDINLCFLRKINRDLQTTRSIEIPSCGGFMIAERTEEHLRLFEEDREAVFFSSDEELLDKVRYYLDHPDQRLLIANAGLRRCRSAGYSYQERFRPIIEGLPTKSSSR